MNVFTSSVCRHAIFDSSRAAVDVCRGKWFNKSNFNKTCGLKFLFEYDSSSSGSSSNDRNMNSKSSIVLWVMHIY